MFEIYIKFCLFWYPPSPYCKKCYALIYVGRDPKSRDQQWSGHWVTKKFLCYFLYLCNKSQGHICWTFIQGCGSGSGLDPDSVTLWIRIHTGNPDPGFGSRGKKIKKFQWKTALFSYFFKKMQQLKRYKIALTFINKKFLWITPVFWIWFDSNFVFKKNLRKKCSSKVLF
jgi:hypothetical protein